MELAIQKQLAMPKPKSCAKIFQINYVKTFKKVKEIRLELTLQKFQDIFYFISVVALFLLHLVDDV